MWKKAVAAIAVVGLLLAGCANNGDVPGKNETPAEKVRDDARQWENDVERDLNGNYNNNGDQSGQQDATGINRNDQQDTTGANQNDHNRNDEEAGNLNDNPQVEIIEDLNRKNNVH